jgi:4,5-DOPA dioxygenase extradiol
MNAIEDNDFTASWVKLGQTLPRPQAILCVSAHWYTEGARTCDLAHPETIYDMYGFPRALYQVSYPAPGSAQLAHTLKDLLPVDIAIDNTWGIDHGTWSVLVRMYPQADIPVVQLGIDALLDAKTHFALGRALGALRSQGVLILGSGNIVHNLSKLDWELQGGYPWADAFDAYIRERTEQRQYEDILHYYSAGDSARQAFITPEHFFPFLYALGAAQDYGNLTVFNDARVMGSLSMTSYLFE